MGCRGSEVRIFSPRPFSSGPLQAAVFIHCGDRLNDSTATPDRPGAAACRHGRPRFRGEGRPCHRASPSGSRSFAEHGHRNSPGNRTCKIMPAKALLSAARRVRFVIGFNHFHRRFEGLSEISGEAGKSRPLGLRFVAKRLLRYPTADRRPYGSRGYAEGTEFASAPF